MKDIEAFVRIFLKQNDYQLYSSPKGEAIKFEMKYKKQIILVNIVYVSDFVTTATEICSTNAVNPYSYFSVEALFSAMNKYQKDYIWHLSNDGFFCLRSTFNYDWRDYYRYPAVVKSMGRKFLSFLSYIEEVAQGRKRYQDVCYELERIGLIK
jgi:hypothetical protein